METAPNRRSLGDWNVTPRAFSLVEMLTVMAIILVLTGIILPLCLRARRQGMMSSDINQMHQIAIAGTMYSSESGTFPVSCFEVVDSGLLPASIFKLSLDPFPEGLARKYEALIQLDRIHQVPTWARSIISLDAFGYSHRQDTRLNNGENLGWAFGATDSSARELEKGAHDIWGEFYHRIQNDGAVRQIPVKRQIEYGSEGYPIVSFETIDFFRDAQP
jgi:prepilin-type N-terminal cleavage/methylation domain-containing protein